MSAEPRMIRTEAEQALLDRFTATADGLPGGQLVRAQREAAFEAFRRTGLPHRRIEEWKYTDLRALMRKAAPPAERPTEETAKAGLAKSPDPLHGVDSYRLVLVDGFFFDSLSDVKALGEAGVKVESIASVLARDGAVLESPQLAAGDIAVALNAAFSADGVSVVVGEAALLDKPLEILHLFTGQAAAATVRNSVRIGARASLKVLETHRGPDGVDYQTNVATLVEVDAGATVAYARLQAEGDRALHLGTTTLRLAPDTRFDHLTVTTGAAVSRSQIFLTTGGDHTKVGLHGAGMVRGKQHADVTLLIDHALPGAYTRVLYKNVVDDEAKGVFQGKIIVEPNAQKTDAKMMSKALLISDGAEFAAKPELEIFADDVQCGHGATSGQIDETQLFYLMARGIERSDAEQLLIEAFLDDAIDGLGDEAIGNALKGVVSTWLAGRRTRAA